MLNMQACTAFAIVITVKHIGVAYSLCNSSSSFHPLLCACHPMLCVTCVSLVNAPGMWCVRPLT